MGAGEREKGHNNNEMVAVHRVICDLTDEVLKRAVSLSIGKEYAC